MNNEQAISVSKLWVLKIGSALLTDPTSGLNQAMIIQLVDQIVALRQLGIAVVLVSSGSIAEGLRVLNISKRPTQVHRLQAAAAAGQMGLIHAYSMAFKRFDVVCAQILLTHGDLENRMRYLNARRTLETLLEMGAIPIINENDTVVTDEVRVDNDTLAALVANLLDAHVLLILTDQDGLYTQDPKYHDDAQLVHQGDAGDPALEKMAGGVGELGTGGMLTKLQAANKAARSGTLTIIANGRQEGVLKAVLNGESIGTWLNPKTHKINARKQWIAGQARRACCLIVDAGAVKALKNKGSSLLPAGIKAVEGDFQRGDIILVIDEQRREIARGVVHYNAVEARKMCGHSSKQMKEILGYMDEPEMINRDNLVVY